MRAALQKSRQPAKAVREPSPGPRQQYLDLPRTVEPLPPVQAKSCACGGGCPSCTSEPDLQPKLAVSSPSDRYDQEADRVAEEVLRAPERAPEGHVAIMPLVPGPRRVGEQAESAQASQDLGAATPDGDASSVLAPLPGSGRPLSFLERSFYERRFGRDFSAVRLHADRQSDRAARRLQALAFTSGRDISFRAGRCPTLTSTGQRLLAHELAHVVQQGWAPQTEGGPATAGQAALHCAPGTVQRDATDESITESYATALGDTELLAEISAVESLLRSPAGGTDAEVLRANLAVLRAESESRPQLSTPLELPIVREESGLARPPEGQRVERAGTTSRDRNPQARRGGPASFVERTSELWRDFRHAIALSRPHLREAIARHVEQAIYDVILSLAIMLAVSVAILAISSGIGAALGLLAGGVTAAPGAAAGFEVGMVIIEWLGLAMLVVWIGQALYETGAAFTRFLGTVWDARGDERTLNRAAREFADALGLLIGNLLEAIVLLALSRGLTAAMRILAVSRFGRSIGESRGGDWLRERVRRVRAGETRIVGPGRAAARFYRGVELIDANGSSIGEFDGVDLPDRCFVENKSGAGLLRVPPGRTNPARTPAQWARSKITGKTTRRIQALSQASGTRPTPRGSATVPDLAELRGIRHVHFVIDADTPALRTAVLAELANLRAAFPGWTFTAEFGVSIWVPPVPLPEQEEDLVGAD